MSELWQDEGFGSGTGLEDEGEESIETDLEDGFDDPEDAEEPEDEATWDEDADDD